MHPASRGLLAVSSTQFAHLLWPGASSEKACEKEFTDYYDIVPDYKPGEMTTRTIFKRHIGGAMKK
jgi:hypothetical protein